MDRTRQKFYLDVGMTAFFLLCLGTGIAKFAPVTRFLGLKASAIAPMTIIHDWSGIAFGLCAIAHLALNWKWMVAMTRKAGTRPDVKPAAAVENPAITGVVSHD
jgi:hypothetical protein